MPHVKQFPFCRDMMKWWLIAINLSCWLFAAWFGNPNTIMILISKQFRKRNTIHHNRYETTVYFGVLRIQHLTHCGLVTPHGDVDLEQGWLIRWFAACDTKSLTESMLTYHRWGPVTFSWGQLYTKYSRYHMIYNVWRLHIWKFCYIFKGPGSCKGRSTWSSLALYP